MDRWYYFLKHAEDLAAVPETLKTESAIKHAFELADKAGLTMEVVYRGEIIRNWDIPSWRVLTFHGNRKKCNDIGT